MAAKRTLGLIAGLTLVSMMAGCASQAPSVTTPKDQGPAIIDGDTLILPSEERSVQQAAGVGGMTLGQRWSSSDFKSLPGRIEAAGAEQAGLIPGQALRTAYPNTFALRYPGSWWGSWSGAMNYCPAPYSVAFGTPAFLPKTLFLHPDVYYLKRQQLYFPYSRLGGYFYPISVPYQARFFTPVLAYGFGSLSTYTFSTPTCPVEQPFPGQLPVGPDMAYGHKGGKSMKGGGSGY